MLLLVRQYGSTTDMAIDILSVMQEFFDDQLVTKGLWPSRCADMLLTDFFLWCCLINLVFRESVTLITELQICITEDINAIT